MTAKQFKDTLQLKDYIQLIMLTITLGGGLYAHAERQADIKINKANIEEIKQEQKEIVKDVNDLKTNDKLKAQAMKAMSDDVKEIKRLLEKVFESELKK